MSGFAAIFLRFSLAGSAVLMLSAVPAEVEAISYRLFASDFSRAWGEFEDVDKIRGGFTLDCHQC